MSRSLNRLILVLRGEIVPREMREMVQPSTNSNNGKGYVPVADTTGVKPIVQTMATEQAQFVKFVEAHTRQNPGVAHGQQPGVLEMLVKG